MGHGIGMGMGKFPNTEIGMPYGQYYGPGIGAILQNYNARGLTLNGKDLTLSIISIIDITN